MSQQDILHPASLGWFARHELTLFWRDWLAMMTAGKRKRERWLAVGLLLFMLMLHGLAYAILAPAFRSGVGPDKASFVMISGSLALSFFMMLSQTLESVTRAFYARADLDLILSSPASARHVFALRVAAIVFTSAAMAMLLAAPFINIAAMIDGANWLAAYPVMIAMSGLATALAIVITIGMFRTIGPKRTRLAAQIVAAVVGASFLIGIQIAAIVWHGNLSRFSVLGSQDVVDAAPISTSLWWLPARAAMGELWALLAMLVVAVAFLVVVVRLFASRFGTYCVAAASIGDTRKDVAGTVRKFKRQSVAQALRAKEWTLLRRDPWLVSQSLMQILYLIPPALLLFQSYGDKAGAFVVLAPVLVMAIGQLSGGLAWLAISGEDAPDLIMSAPVSRAAVTFAKIEVVLRIVIVLSAPLIIVMALSNSAAALWTAVCLLAASGSAILIQQWFQVQAKRSNFRRRQVSSRAATFSEAFSSIMWAGAAFLAVAGSGFAAIFVFFALLVLFIAWLISPRKLQ